jgi:hypothetical protein
MHPIEVPRLAGSVLVFPVVARWIGDVFFEIEKFFLLVEFLFGFRSVESLRSKICTARSFFIGSLGNWLSCLGNKS